MEVTAEEAEAKKLNRKMMTGLAIGLYILCPIPLFIIQNEIGLCLLLVIVAIATGILIWRGGEAVEEHKRAEQAHMRPETELERSISKLVSTVTLIIYLIVSFSTGAWFITWIIFPIAGAVKGLIRALLDLKEAEKNGR